MPLWTVLIAGALATDPAPPPDTDPPEAQASTPHTPADPVSPELLDQGGRPRRPLRLRVPSADHWQLQVQRSHTSTVDGEEIPGATSVLAADVRHDGDRLEVLPQLLHIDGAPIEGQAAAQEAARSLATDRPIHAAIDPSQRTRLDADPTDRDETAGELLAELVWTLNATAIPLPDGRLGPGARWTWRQEAVEEGVPVEQRWTAELVSSTRRTATLRLRLDGASRSEETDATIEAEGKVWLRLDRPLARAAELTLTAQLTQRAPSPQDTDAGAPEPIQAALTAQITLATRDVAPEGADGR